jgi:hypothetical protein
MQIYFIPFNDHILRKLHDRFIKHQEVIDLFSSLFPSERDLIKSQIERFLKLARFCSADLPEYNDVISEGELRMWHQRYINETVP